MKKVNFGALCAMYAMYTTLVALISKDFGLLFLSLCAAQALALVAHMDLLTKSPKRGIPSLAILWMVGNAVLVIEAFGLGLVKGFYTLDEFVKPLCLLLVGIAFGGFGLFLHRIAVERNEENDFLAAEAEGTEIKYAYECGRISENTRLPGWVYGKVIGVAVEGLVISLETLPYGSLQRIPQFLRKLGNGARLPKGTEVKTLQREWNKISEALVALGHYSLPRNWFAVDLEKNEATELGIAHRYLPEKRKAFVGGDEETFAGIIAVYPCK